MKKLLVLCLAFVMLFGCSAPKDNEGGMTVETGKLVVGMECDYAPFNWTQPNDSDYAVAFSEVDYADGYDVVMAQKIADELDLELVIKKIGWDGLLEALNSKEIDLVIAGMTDNEERRVSADFTEPYYESEMVIIVRKDSALTSATSIQDFSGHKVLGQMNTTYDAIIDQIDGVIHVTPLDSYSRMVVSLLENEVEGITAEMPVAQGVVAANPELAIVSFTEGNGFVVDTSVSIALRKGNTELQTAVQGVLDTIDQPTRNQMMLDATNRQPSKAE